MAYTPELSNDQSRTLRRIAWALDLPMTKTMNAAFEYVGDVIDSKIICAACKDKSRCLTCTFYKQSSNHDQQATKKLCLSAVIKTKGALK